MPATTLDAFADSLGEQSVKLTRTTATDATATIVDEIDGPAVGASLPFEGVALPDDVTTDPTPSDLDAAQTGITPARLGIADYGSVVVGDAGDGSEAASLFVDVHVAVVAASDVVPSMSAAIDRLGNEIRAGLTSAVVATGPSATADMGALVKGAHGPRSVRVVVLTDR